jgi:hypothetical protein
MRVDVEYYNNVTKKYKNSIYRRYTSLDLIIKRAGNVSEIAQDFGEIVFR